MSILTGSYALVLLGPEQQAIAQAQGAAAKLYATIDRVPTIDSLSDEGLKPDQSTTDEKQEKPGQKKGHIKFEEVVFRYPSRPDVRILNGKCPFPALYSSCSINCDHDYRSQH
jgi:ATP-binding cassette subfamily B (MDR/TAP) protein 1